MAGGAGGSAGTETLLRGDKGGAGEGRDTWPGVTCPPGLARTHLSSAGRRARRATASWYRGGWGGRGGHLRPPPPKWGLPELLRPPQNLSGSPPGRRGPSFTSPFRGQEVPRPPSGPHPAPDARGPLSSGLSLPSSAPWVPPTHLDPAGQAEVAGGRWRCHGGPGGGLGGIQVCGARRGPGGFSGPPKLRPWLEPGPWAGPEVRAWSSPGNSLWYLGGAPGGAYRGWRGGLGVLWGFLGSPLSLQPVSGGSLGPTEPLSTHRSHCGDLGCPYGPYSPCMGPLKLFRGCL